MSESDSQTSERTEPRIAVIVPARDAAATIGACLTAIGRQTWPIADLIVFDDGSSDATGALAESYGARLMSHRGKPLGPAAGRNRAAWVAEADYLFFVDADVTIYEDTLERLLIECRKTGAVAAFGSYDDAPPSRRMSSLYANLRHHFTHQTGDRDAVTFWSGIGLIRRDVFIGFDGFDAELYPLPSIEDIELGSRIARRGHRIRLVPDARGSHWKDWSVRRLWHADVIMRAVPWATLIADGRAADAALNVAPAERAKALVAGMILVFVPAAAVWPAALVATLLLVVVYIVVNRAFFALLARQAGLRGLVVGILLHWCYHIYASATFLIVMAARRLGRRGARRG
jgi:glycosyltransferase involved in cell wall biosynthesis